MNNAGDLESFDGAEIAIIGMAGRFPGANDLDLFWRNLRDGVESITFFSDEELKQVGVDPTLLADPSYVKAAPVLDNVEDFDAAFFGYTPREAEFMDPQQRLFLECAWTALEHAGYAPEQYKGAIGVFAGAKTSTYMFNLFANPDVMRTLDLTEIGLGNDLANLATRISYKLNLRGPSYALHTACSTSLVAVHLACQSLLIDECQIALAGGVAVNVPHKAGYRYQHGGIVSPDGHCRPFDAAAQGTLFGSGVGVVALKRLADALDDGDTIHAVIRGSATNNDGSAKASFTAPGVEGQAAVISSALANAAVRPETIDYVEAHGTGTSLGDSIEIRALTRAFRASTQKRQFCAIGSVKSNIGHLDTAAGISSLLKTVLALKHQQLPPSLHFETPSPAIDFSISPFYVNSRLGEWRTNGHPRRAGVSSFGFGSTNAHVILEEAPVVEPSDSGKPWQLLTLSAKSATALDAATANLAAHLREQPQLNLADVAYTLQIGRRAFDHRRVLVCTDRDDALHALETRDPQRLLTTTQTTIDRPVVFLFPGQGAQYVDMGRQLYQTEPVFRQQIDRCAELLKPHLGLDIRAIMFDESGRGTIYRAHTDESDAGTIYRAPTDAVADTSASGTIDHGPTDAVADTSASGTIYRAPTNDADTDSSIVHRPSSEDNPALDQTQYAQPALFVVEYALAQLWLSWGLKPQAMIGHSLGEYVAACLAGVFTLEQALKLVAARGKLMQQLPGGSMLAVALPERELHELLADELALAAVNGPAQCVVSGPHQAVEALHERLRAQSVVCRRLHTSHAFHSATMDPILEQFTKLVGQVRLSAPRMAYISNVTGTWITAEEATNPAYWARHLRETVRFAEGVGTLLKEDDSIFLEVGPGQTLGTFARQQIDRGAGVAVLSSLRHPREQQPDVAFLLASLGRLWLAGATIDWPRMYGDERRMRVPLPTYPFERRRFWIEPGRGAGALAALAALEKRADLDDWFYAPSWKRAALADDREALSDTARPWLVFTNGDSFSARFVARLRQAQQEVIAVSAGDHFDRRDDGDYILDPHQPAEYAALLDDLRARDRLPGRIVHLWNITLDAAAAEERFGEAQAHGFYSLLFLAQALAQQDSAAELRIDIVANGLHEVIGGETLAPEKATLLGPCKVIPQEHPNISCRSIDIIVPAETQAAALIDQLLAELAAPASDSVVAYRGPHRWVQSFARTRLPAQSERTALRERGVYLITGGLGGIGLALAEHLAHTVQARLVLVGRSTLPERSQWEQWLAEHGEEDRTSARIRKLLAIEQTGAELLVVSADVADQERMRSVIAQALERFGALHGVIHAAGVAGGGLIQLKTRELAEQVLAPKLRGALALDSATCDLPLDFMALFSSLTAVVGELGQSDYCAANAFLDAFAHQRTATGRRTLAINWDTWREIGMAVSADVPAEVRQMREQVLADGILPAEGMAAFDRAIAQRALSQVLVSTRDLEARIAQATAMTQAMVRAALEQSTRPAHARPELATAYVMPANAFEQTIAEIWQQMLGIEQVGVHDNFFELGGHSLLITQLLNKLTKAYGVDIPLRSLFDQPTVAGMAGLVAHALEQQPEAEQQPIAKRVRDTPAERQSLLEDYFRHKVSAALDITPEQLPADGDLRSYDLAMIVADLQWNFQQDFRLQVYPNEIPQLISIEKLARFTAAELDRKASLKQVTTTRPESLYERYEGQVRPSKIALPVRRPAKKNPPIAFLHSSPRSGSTLLRVMLAGHPALFSPPELDILWYEGMRDWQRSLTDADFGHGFHWVSQGLQWTFMQLLGLDAEATKAFMDDLVAQDTPIDAIYARLQELSAPRLLVDKSPSYSMSLGTLRRGAELFENAKYIHLVRHPYAMIESFLRIRLDKLFGPSVYGADDVDPYVIAEKIWVTCNGNVRTLLQEVDPQHQYLLRYEDLVKDPRGIMGELCEFLEIPFDEVVLQPYDNKRERMITGIGDPNILEHSAIDPQLGEAWRQIVLPHQLGEPARRLAAEYGYELPTASAPEPDLAEDDMLARILQAVDQLSQEEAQEMVAALTGGQL